MAVSNQNKYQVLSSFGRIINIDSVAAAPANAPTAGRIVFQAEGQTCRFRPDGVAPTASIGLYVTGSTPSWYEYTGDLTKCLFIAAVAGGFINYMIFE